MSLVEKNFGRALGVRRVGIFFALKEEFRGGDFDTGCPHITQPYAFYICVICA